jgi:chromosome partitioning protein
MSTTTNVISVINQKGGVGKTTSTINMASYLAKAGHSVLIIDADSQANATSGLGIDRQSVRDSLYELLVGEAKFADVVRRTSHDGLEVVPSSARLASVDYDLANISKREFVLKQILATTEKKYDYVLIDCPPSLGLMTVNALSASDHVLIPVQAEYYALEGLSQLLQVVQTVKQSYNAHLEILGVVITMYDKRTLLATQVQSELDNYFKQKLFKTTIPRNVKLAEAPSFGKPIADHDKWSKGARAYKALTKELMQRTTNNG